MLRINKYLLWIGTIVILNLKGFYLINSDKIPCSDIVFIIECLFLIYVFYKHGIGNLKKYCISMLFPIVLVVTSAVMAKISYNQPIFMGMSPQRHWLLAILMYFPITRLLDKRKISSVQLLDMIDFINIFLSIVVIFQFILKDSFIFMQAYSSERYGSIRLYITTAFLVISYFRYFIILLMGEKIKIRGYYLIFVTVFTYLFITKSRMAMVSLLISTIVAIFITKLNKKKLWITIILILGIVVFCTTSPGQMIISSLFLDSNQDAGIAIRELGRTFYIDSIKKSTMTTIFGCGYANMNWYQAYIGSGMANKYFYNDHGILGLTFYYGLSILIWMIYIYIKMMRKSWKKGKKSFLFYMLVGIIGSYTLIPDAYSSIVAFPIVCAIIDSDRSVGSAD